MMSGGFIHTIVIYNSFNIQAFGLLLSEISIGQLSVGR